MERRLSQQLMLIIEADKAGHLTPAIQHRLSEMLDAFHLQEQHRFPGGSVGAPTMPSPHLLPVSKAGLAPYMGASVKVPKVSFPKLPAAPKLGKVA